MQTNKKDTATALEALIQQIQNIERKAKLLDGIPCGTDYPQCKFIRDANVAVANLQHVQNEQESTQVNLSTIDKKIQSMRPSFVADQISKYDAICDKRLLTTNDIADLNSLNGENLTLEDIKLIQELLPYYFIVQFSFLFLLGFCSIFFSGLAFDSQLCKKNFIFFAIKGTDYDGHRYIDKAIQNGAKTIVHQKLSLIHISEPTRPY